LGTPYVAAHRRDLLSSAQGEILEIGFGTGLNLPHYPESVRKITVIDPNPGMHRRAQQRIDASHVEVEKHLIRSEQLPFADATFDCVVSTFTLCSVADVTQAMREVYRVLRPGGQFLFLEHGLSSDPKVQRWQQRLNWLQRHLAGNCHLNREMRGLISTVAFSTFNLTNFYLEKTPRTHGYMYLGSATK
jgi:ubiquinone/menaquinone biosynthesis C-methylase UbiE